MSVITSRPFGVSAKGESITLHTMQNSSGMSVTVLDYGCTVQSIRLNGLDVVLGYDDVAGYENGGCFIGAFVGRYANRIKGSAFDLNGKHYVLPKNVGENHLHGVLAEAVFSAAVEGDSLVLRYLSPDGEEGFPGNCSVTVKYTLSEENELIMDYFATTDADTVLNLTNHSYFNLNGEASGDILGHTLTLAADSYTETDDESIPTGRIIPVAGTPMDFRQEKAVGRDIFADYAPIRTTSGYDQNFILSEADGSLRHFATLRGDKTGIVMDAYTTQPAVQLYCGNFLKGSGKGGRKFIKHAALCLETQHYPSSPNFPEFPTTVLKAGDEYRQTTVYKFTF